MSDTEKPPVLLFQSADVARELDLTPAAVRVLADKGHIPCVRTPSGRRLFRPEDVQAFKATYTRGERRS